MSEITFSTVRYAVACWLRYGKQCPVVAFERGGHGHVWSHPDVFAVNEDRQTYDVEIKMSFSDFKADGKKDKFHPKLIDNPRVARPTWFYYAAPMPLAEKIMASTLLPGGAGLLGITGFREMGQDGVVVLLRAEKHKASERPRLRHLATWVKDQSGTLCGLAKQIAVAHDSSALAEVRPGL